ncbi:MAG: ABC transporter permease subunit [Firmicutes bacterium]|nr:ABC transporter permease subunit [Bacillota bacterium]
MRKRRFSTDQIILQLCALVGLAWYIIFCYVPYFGLTIAFKNFDLSQGFFGGSWAGLQYFAELFKDPQLGMVIRNTFVISLLKIVICFPAAIIFAVLLNEVTKIRYKRVIQTVSYFPHFLSWIILSLVMIYWFSSDFGLVNDVLTKLHLINKPLDWLNNPSAFWWLAMFTELWKETGWSAILFIAAISGIDPTLYEAAVVDGASRIKRIFFITLPSIKGTVVLMFLLTFCNIFSGVGGTFEQSMFMGNALNYNTSIVLGYYTLQTGLNLGRFSYATAVGLINGLVALALLLGSNAFCKRFLGRGLYTGGEGQ